METKKIISPERLAKLREAGRLGGIAKGGKKSAKKLKELQLKAAIEQRAMQLADNALNSIAVAAFGSYVVAEIVIDEKTDKKRLVPVRDATQISLLIDTGEHGIDYMILEGTAPDYKAALEIINRGIGKVKETTDIHVKHSFSLVGLAKERSKLPPATLPAISHSRPIDVPFTESKAPPSAV